MVPRCPPAAGGVRMDVGPPGGAGAAGVDLAPARVRAVNPEENGERRSGAAPLAHREAGFCAHAGQGGSRPARAGVSSLPAPHRTWVRRSA